MRMLAVRRVLEDGEKPSLVMDPLDFAARRFIAGCVIRQPKILRGMRNSQNSGAVAYRTIEVEETASLLADQS